MPRDANSVGFTAIPPLKVSRYEGPNENAFSWATGFRTELNGTDSGWIQAEACQLRKCLGPHLQARILSNEPNPPTSLDPEFHSPIPAGQIQTLFAQ